MTDNRAVPPEGIVKMQDVRTEKMMLQKKHTGKHLPGYLRHLLLCLCAAVFLCAAGSRPAEAAAALSPAGPLHSSSGTASPDASPQKYTAAGSKPVRRPAVTSSSERSLQELPGTSSDSGITAFGGYILPSDLKNELQELIGITEKDKKRIGFLLVDIASGQGVACNAEEPFYSASTIKAPYIFSLAAKETGFLEKYEKQ